MYHQHVHKRQLVDCRFVPRPDLFRDRYWVAERLSLGGPRVRRRFTRYDESKSIVWSPVTAKDSLGTWNHHHRLTISSAQTTLWERFKTTKSKRSEVSEKHSSPQGYEPSKRENSASSLQDQSKNLFVFAQHTRTFSDRWWEREKIFPRKSRHTVQFTLSPLADH